MLVLLFGRGKIALSARKVVTVQKIVPKNPILYPNVLKFVWNVVIPGMKCGHARENILQMTWRWVNNTITLYVEFHIWTSVFYIFMVFVTGNTMLCLQVFWASLLCKLCRWRSKRGFLLQMWSVGPFWLGNFFKLHYKFDPFTLIDNI